MRTFNTNDISKSTDLVSYVARLSQNTSPSNIELLKGMINDTHRYLLEKYFFNEASTTFLTVSQQQFYDLPADYSKMKTATITIGSLKWTPSEILTRTDWDKLNVFPYYGDIPNNYFIYNNREIGFWPIPSTAGNTITINYKKRVTDLSLSDYTTGSVTVTNNSPTVTGLGTAFLTTYLPSAGSVLDLNLYIKVNQPKGDGKWYQISSITSDTVLTLVNNYTGSNTATATFVIGQAPLLTEDFHDLLVYRPLMIYFSTLVDNPNKKAEFEGLYNAGIALLDKYAGSKTVNVNLRGAINTINPNIYPQSIG
jgi:hypothetical protein